MFIRDLPTALCGSPGDLKRYLSARPSEVTAIPECIVCYAPKLNPATVLDAIDLLSASQLEYANHEGNTLLHAAAEMPSSNETNALIDHLVYSKQQDPLKCNYSGIDSCVKHMNAMHRGGDKCVATGANALTRAIEPWIRCERCKKFCKKSNNI